MRVLEARTPASEGASRPVTWPASPSRRAASSSTRSDRAVRAPARDARCRARGRLAYSTSPSHGVVGPVSEHVTPLPSELDLVASPDAEIEAIAGAVDPDATLGVRARRRARLDQPGGVDRGSGRRRRHARARRGDVRDRRIDGADRTDVAARDGREAGASRPTSRTAQAAHRGRRRGCRDRGRCPARASRDARRARARHRARAGRRPDRAARRPAARGEGRDRGGAARAVARAGVSPIPQADRLAALAALRTGHVVKAHVAFATPWWRESSRPFLPAITDSACGAVYEGPVGHPGAALTCFVGCRAGDAAPAAPRRRPRRGDPRRAGGRRRRSVSGAVARHAHRLLERAAGDGRLVTWCCARAS